MEKTYAKERYEDIKQNRDKQVVKYGKMTGKYEAETNEQEKRWGEKKLMNNGNGRKPIDQHGHRRNGRYEKGKDRKCMNLESNKQGHGHR